MSGLRLARALTFCLPERRTVPEGSGPPRYPPPADEGGLEGSRSTLVEHDAEMTRRSVGDDLTEPRDALRALAPAESLLGMAQAVQQLSRNIVTLIEKFDACDARLNQFEATERALAELLLHLARQRVPNNGPVPAAPSSELNALAHDITEIKQTEKKIQGSLQTIDSALAHIANRLSVIEAKISREGGSAPDSQSSPAIKVLTPAAPIPTEVPIAPEQSATAATAEPEASAPT